MQLRLQARLGGRRIRFGNLRIDAELADVGDAKQFRVRGLAGVDEVADVGIARGHDAVEGREHPFERLEFAQALYVLPRRLDHCGLGRRIARTVVRVLLGNRLRLEQILPAIIGDLGEREVRLGRSRGRRAPARARGRPRESRFPRAVRPLCTRAPMSVYQALHIAVGTRVDRRLDIGLDDARQHQLVAGIAQLRLGGHHGENRVRVVLLRSSDRRMDAGSRFPRRRERGL